MPRTRNKKWRHCNICNYNWQPSTRKRLPRCPHCKTQYWDLPRSYQINQNTPPNKSEERQHYLSSTIGVVSPARIIILAIFVVSILFMAWFLSQPPSCNPERQVQLTGILMGFEKNEVRWHVRIDNKSYVFNHFDKGYMEKMLGFNVTILCCLRTSDYKPYSVYSMLNCYITDCEECD